jgi:hypothetical protein
MWMRENLAMSESSKPLGYSADVRLELSVNGFVLPIGQLGPDFLILDNPPNHAPVDAEIAVWIDDEESRWKVHLPDGISADRPRTRTARCKA